MRDRFEQKALELPKANSLALNIVHRTAISIDAALSSLTSGHHPFSPGETYRSARELLVTQIGAFKEADVDAGPYLELLEEMYGAVAGFSSAA